MQKAIEGKQRQKHKELNLIPRTQVALVRRKQANCWALLSRQPSPLGEFQACERPCLKDKVDSA